MGSILPRSSALPADDGDPAEREDEGHHAVEVVRRRHQREEDLPTGAVGFLGTFPLAGNVTNQLRLCLVIVDASFISPWEFPASLMNEVR